MYSPPGDDDRSAAGASPPMFNNQRYAYLVARLRNRQITMEEATELFALQQAMIRAAYQPAPSSSRAPPPPPPPPSASSPTASVAPLRPMLSDDAFLLGLMAIGAGSGLIAALIKRSQELSPGVRSPERKTPPSAAPPS